MVCQPLAKFQRRESERVTGAHVTARTWVVERIPQPGVGRWGRREEGFPPSPRACSHRRPFLNPPPPSREEHTGCVCCLLACGCLYMSTQLCGRTRKEDVPPAVSSPVAAPGLFIVLRFKQSLPDIQKENPGCPLRLHLRDAVFSQVPSFCREPSGLCRVQGSETRPDPSPVPGAGGSAALALRTGVHPKMGNLRDPEDRAVSECPEPGVCRASPQGDGGIAGCLVCVPPPPPALPISKNRGEPSPPARATQAQVHSLPAPLSREGSF